MKRVAAMWEYASPRPALQSQCAHITLPLFSTPIHALAGGTESLWELLTFAVTGNLSIQVVIIHRKVCSPLNFRWRIRVVDSTDQGKLFPTAGLTVADSSKPWYWLDRAVPAIIIKLPADTHACAYLTFK